MARPGQQDPGKHCSLSHLPFSHSHLSMNESPHPQGAQPSCESNEAVPRADSSRPRHTGPGLVLTSAVLGQALVRAVPNV